MAKSRFSVSEIAMPAELIEFLALENFFAVKPWLLLLSFVADIDYYSTAASLDSESRLFLISKTGLCGVSSV